MKYYVILLVVFDNDTADKVAIYKYNTEAEAIQNFYKYMGQYVNGTNVKSVCVEAKNNVGGIYKNEAWVAPEVEPADEVTAE